MIGSPEERLRRAAAVLMGRKGDKDSINYLRDLLDDVKDIRVQCARSLGKIGASEGLPLLFRLKNDESSSVRAEVAEAMGEIGGSETLTVLQFLSTDPSHEVRLNSFLALSRLGERGREVIAQYREKYPIMTREAMLGSYSESD